MIICTPQGNVNNLYLFHRVRKASGNARKQEQLKPPTKNLALNNVRRLFQRKLYRLRNQNLITHASRAAEVAVAAVVAAAAVEVAVRRPTRDGRGLCLPRTVIGKLYFTYLLVLTNGQIKPCDTAVMPSSPC